MTKAQIRKDAIARIRAGAPELSEADVILWVSMVDAGVLNARDPWSDDEINLAITQLRTARQ